jgi:hypothetical protein
MMRDDTGDVAVSRLLLGVALFLPLGLSGCLHKKAQAVVLPVSKAPMVLASATEPENPPMLEEPPPEELSTPIAEAAAIPRPKRKPTRPAAPASANTSPTTPPQVASVEGLGEDSAIGELTAGGDATPQTRQDAADLIASNDKRLKALPASTVKAQRSQINKILNFQRQALNALNSGDAEGAKTLATKAKLLLHDLDQGGGE